MVINRFRGDYYFLSNFHPAKIEYNGLVYGSAEAAFQAQKCPERASEFCHLGPKSAKALGSRVELRKDWEDVKIRIMFSILLCKFTQNPDLKEMLLNTGDAVLIEGNTWGDTYWGACRGTGKNILGRLLMTARKAIRENVFDKYL